MYVWSVYYLFKSLIYFFFLATRQRDEAYITQMLDTSAQFVPDILDSER